MQKLLKYKWAIVVYIAYVAILPWLGHEVLRWNQWDFWPQMLIDGISLPLIGCIIFHVIKKLIGLVYSNDERVNKYVDSEEGKENNKEVTPSNVSELDREVTPLLQFIAIHGKKRVRTHIDGYTGDVEIRECTFTNAEGVEEHAWVAKNIRKYTIEDVKRNKDRLAIVLQPSGQYCLCIPREDVIL